MENSERISKLVEVLPEYLIKEKRSELFKGIPNFRMQAVVDLSIKDFALDVISTRKKLAHEGMLSVFKMAVVDNPLNKYAKVSLDVFVLTTSELHELVTQLYEVNSRTSGYIGLANFRRFHLQCLINIKEITPISRLAYFIMDNNPELQKQVFETLHGLVETDYKNQPVGFGLISLDIHVLTLDQILNIILKIKESNSYDW